MIFKRRIYGHKRLIIKKRMISKTFRFIPILLFLRKHYELSFTIGKKSR